MKKQTQQAPQTDAQRLENTEHIAEFFMQSMRSDYAAHVAELRAALKDVASDCARAIERIDTRPVDKLYFNNSGELQSADKVNRMSAELSQELRSLERAESLYAQLTLAVELKGSVLSLELSKLIAAQSSNK